MRRALASLALALLALACGPRVEGSGVSKSEARTVAAFSGVESANGIEVELHVGGAASVNVTGDDNIVPLVQTEVSKNWLHIGFKPGSNVNTKTPLHVDVVAPSLTAIWASSGSHLKASGAADSLALEASSGAHLDAGDLAARTVAVSASSGAHVTLRATDWVRGEASSGAQVKVLGDPKERKVPTSSGATVSYP